MTRKMALNCFFNNELENELEERALTCETTLTKNHTTRDVLNNVDELRRGELYTHVCSENCKAKGTLLCVFLKLLESICRLFFSSFVHNFIE